MSKQIEPEIILTQTNYFLKRILFLGVLLIGLVGTASALDTVRALGGDANKAKLPTISSSDFNAAATMLYEWWGLFEAPDSSAVLPRFNEIFREDVHLKIGDQEINGRDQLKTIFAALPPRQLSHHDVEITVNAPNENTLLIEADFLYQAKPEGEKTTTGVTHYAHTLERQSDGSLLFAKLTGHVVEPKEDREFTSSYVENRARASLSKYLAVTDVLNSDYADLNAIMSGNTEITGMFDPNKITFNERNDGVLKGRAEIANWLSNRQVTFEKVAHRIGSITVESSGDNTYKAAAEIITNAWPKEGEQISVVVPVTIDFIDDGSRYMQIAKISR